MSESTDTLHLVKVSFGFYENISAIEQILQACLLYINFEISLSELGFAVYIWKKLSDSVVDSIQIPQSVKKIKSK